MALTPSRITALHLCIDTAETLDEITTIVTAYPGILNGFKIESQENIDILEYLLTKNCLPTEEYLFRICDNETLGVVNIMCKYDAFKRVLGSNDDLSLYAAKQNTAKVLLDNGMIDHEMYSSYLPVWTTLGF